MKASNRIIVSLDVQDSERARSLILELEECITFKIGHYLSMCPEFHDLVVDYNFWSDQSSTRGPAQFFIDFKYFDIPDTVFEAVWRLSKRRQITMCTVHAERATMVAASKAAEGSNLKILAVSLLTSMDEKSIAEFFNSEESAVDFVLRKADLAVECGCHGLICSPQEVAAVRSIVPDDFLLVTPGTRPIGSALHGHSRTGTPAQAIRDGADYLVVGRPIIEATNRREAFDKIVEEIK